MLLVQGVTRPDVCIVGSAVSATKAGSRTFPTCLYWRTVSSAQPPLFPGMTRPFDYNNPNAETLEREVTDASRKTHECTIQQPGIISLFPFCSLSARRLQWWRYSVRRSDRRGSMSGCSWARKVMAHMR